MKELLVGFVDKKMKTKGMSRRLEGGVKIQKRYFHVCNMRSERRIGPHNEDVISVMMGSMLGRGVMNRRSGEGVRMCNRQSIRNKGYIL